MSLRIHKSGLYTTIQDLGRYGYQKEGMPVSGAMDALALRIANLLVGNNEGAAAIEITVQGPSISIEKNCLLAITGADLQATINGKTIGLWRPVFVQEGSLLELGPAVNGSRAYLAVSGSFAIPQVMGSYATYAAACIGGLHGKPLQKGDTIPCKEITGTGKAILQYLGRLPDDSSFVQTTWAVTPEFYSNAASYTIIRIIKGLEYQLFSDKSTYHFWNEAFYVSPQSNRMGYRLEGPRLNLAAKTELLSSAVTFGTIQVPPEGNPIILMADHQTTGGYPRIGVAATADFCRLAQVLPGKTIRFKEVSLLEAEQLYIAQEQWIEKVKRSLKLKWK